MAKKIEPYKSPFSAVKERFKLQKDYNPSLPNATEADLSAPPSNDVMPNAAEAGMEAGSMAAQGINSPVLAAAEEGKKLAIPMILPVIKEEQAKAKTQEQKAALNNETQGYLNNFAQDVKNAGPEADKAALAEEHAKALNDRAAIEGRGLTGGERIAMAVLGAAPAMLAAAFKGNVAQASQAGNTAASAVIAASKADQDSKLEQQDKVIGGIEKRQAYNQADLNREDEQAYGLLKQDKALAAQARHEAKMQDRQAELLGLKLNQQSQKHYDNAVAMSSGARGNPEVRVLQDTLRKAESGVALLNKRSNELMDGKHLYDLNDHQLTDVLGKLTSQQRYEVAGALDSMIKGGVGTVSGSEHLTAKDASSWAADKAKWLSGDPDVPSNIGRLVHLQLNSLEAEHDLIRNKLDQHYNAAKIGLKGDDAAMEKFNRWVATRKPVSLRERFSSQSKQQDSEYARYLELKKKLGK